MPVTCTTFLVGNLLAWLVITITTEQAPFETQITSSTKVAALCLQQVKILQNQNLHREWLQKLKFKAKTESFASAKTVHHHFECCFQFI